MVLSLALSTLLLLRPFLFAELVRLRRSAL